MEAFAHKAMQLLFVVHLTVMVPNPVWAAVQLNDNTFCGNSQLIFPSFLQILPKSHLPYRADAVVLNQIYTSEFADKQLTFLAEDVLVTNDVFTDYTDEDGIWSADRDLTVWTR